MTLEELNNVATWIGVAGAILLGLAGFIVSLFGLSQARKATAVAVDANRISEESNELSRANAARAEEQHDVAWEWRWDEQLSGLVQIQNIGKNRAREATIQFFYQGITEAAGPQTVEGRDSVRLQIPGLREDIIAERQRLTDLVAETTKSTFVGNIPWTPSPIRTRLRVTWRTDSGFARHFDGPWETDHGLPT